MDNGCATAEVVRLYQSGIEIKSIIKRVRPVSYTHLDVYKRQALRRIMISLCLDVFLDIMDKRMKRVSSARDLIKAMERCV